MLIKPPNHTSFSTSLNLRAILCLYVYEHKDYMYITLRLSIVSFRIGNQRKVLPITYYCC
jgi:hypothetical protein